MIPLLLMLILAIVSQNLSAEDAFTLNPIMNQHCSDFDPFISSTEYAGKFFLHPWKKDERRGDWYQNRAYCAKHCAEMVTIDSEAENVFFHKFMRYVGMEHPGAWLGAQIYNTNDICYWYNGKRFTYSVKAPGEYNEPGLTCLTVGWENNKDWWRNYYCKDDRYLIACQRFEIPYQMAPTHVPATTTTTTTTPRPLRVEVSKIICVLKLFQIPYSAYATGHPSVFQFDIKDDNDNVTSFYVDFKTASGKIDSGESPYSSKIVIQMSDSNFVQLMKKEISGVTAFYNGQVKVTSGNALECLKLEDALKLIENANDVRKLEKQC